MVQSRLGRNALEVFNELSMVLGMNKPRKQKLLPADGADKTSKKQKPYQATDTTDNPPTLPADQPVDVAPALNATSPEAVALPPPEVNAPQDRLVVPTPTEVPASTRDGDVRSPDDPGISHAPVAPPKAPAEPAKKAKPKRPSTLPIAKAIADTKILVVNDNEMIRNLVKVQLHELGYTQCTVAESGSEAVKLATEILPDFIFMEICMPGEIDGIDAAREIRKHINTRIIFLTNNCDSEIVKRAGEVSPEGYILKPYTIANSA